MKINRKICRKVKCGSYHADAKQCGVTTTYFLVNKFNRGGEQTESVYRDNGIVPKNCKYRVEHAVTQ